MYNNTNPAEIYAGTTWELLTAGKYIQTGNTALTTGGSNSVSIGKANLPAVKLKVDSFSLTGPSHYHLTFNKDTDGASRDTNKPTGNNYPTVEVQNNHNYYSYCIHGTATVPTLGRSSTASGTTSSASPNTETLGSGTALNIQPSYITLKFWKRLT